MDRKQTRLPALAAEQQLGPAHHRFRLLTQSGLHPLGELWNAQDISTSGSPEVTLLILSDLLACQDRFIDTLRTAIAQTRQLQHPHLATCYGLFADRTGHRFLSFEPLGGRTLASLIEQRQLKALSPLQKQGLIIQSAKALEHASRISHKCHGALCPELIFLPAGKGVKLLGFHWRMALQPFQSLLNPALSYPQYQSPEAFHPEPLSSSADTYALAALTYHLFQGKAPFSASDDEASRFQRVLKAPSGLSAPQWQILQRALSADPAQRQPEPLQLARELFQDPEEAALPSTEEALPESPPDADKPRHQSANWSGTLLSGARIRRKLFTGWKPRWPAGLSLLTERRFLAGLISGLLIGLMISFLLLPDTSGHLPGQRLSDERGPDEQGQYEQGQSTAAVLETLSAPTAPDPLDDGSLPLPPLNGTELSPALAGQPDADASPDDHFLDDTQEETTRVFQDLFGPGQSAPAMVTLPAGSFMMGDLDGRGDDNERPVREVTISHAFALSRYEVTFAEYDQFALATNRRLPDDEGWGRGDRPVINVSWHDAQAYTQWLRQQTGQPYRLPTEAEWEYAARAGTDTSYWWGNELLPGHAVCDECGSEWDGRQSAPVGQFAPNAWGLFDMHGNVDEWVQDCYEDSYLGAPTDGSARVRSGCTHQVMRGGSWFDIPRVIRASSRYRHPANASRNTWGFRVALDLPD